MFKEKSLYLLILVLLSSCFEYVEEISFENNESGVYELTLNCSQSKTRLKNLLKLDTFLGYRLPSEELLREKIAQSETVLKASKGISLVSKSMDFNQFIFTLKFHFDSVHNLNTALNSIASLHSRHALPFLDLYAFKDNNFQRLSIPDSLIKPRDKKNLKLFDGASVSTIYRFKKPVEKVSNPKAIISKNKMAVMLKLQASEIANNPNIITNTIQLK